MITFLLRYEVMALKLEKFPSGHVKTGSCLLGALAGCIVLTMVTGASQNFTYN